MTTFISLIILAAIVIAAVVVVIAGFYQRSTREVSLVRTGVGGRKIIIDGGTVVLTGSLAPDGAVIKQTAADPSLLRHTGQAVVFADRADLDARIDDLLSQRRPLLLIIFPGKGVRVHNLQGPARRRGVNAIDATCHEDAGTRARAG